MGFQKSSLISVHRKGLQKAAVLIHLDFTFIFHRKATSVWCLYLKTPTIVLFCVVNIAVYCIASAFVGALLEMGKGRIVVQTMSSCLPCAVSHNCGAKECNADDSLVV